jgi:mitochondrial intermediate peptidase
MFARRVWPVKVLHGRGRALSTVVPVSPTDAILGTAFDSSTPSPSQPTKPVGLFNQPALRHPSQLVPLAKRTAERASILVDRILRLPNPSWSPEEALLKTVKQIDRLSDLLCRVIDLSECLRNVHPDRAWIEAAESTYEQLVEYMNHLNTNKRLYEVCSTFLILWSDCSCAF